MKKDGKDEIEKKVERLEKETEKQRVCIKEKDKRITKMEERWEIIYGAGITIWYGFWIFISYWSILNVWVQIAGNGKYSLIEWFNSHKLSVINRSGVPHTLDTGPGLMLAIIMVIILILLTFGWFFWICIIRDDE